MSYFTQKLESENFILSIFYGVMTSQDIYDHVYNINAVHDISDDTRILTDMTNVTENKSITLKTIFFMTKVRKRHFKDVDAKGVLLINNDAIKSFAQKFIDRSSFKDGNLVIMQDFDHALASLGKESLKEKIEEIKIKVLN